MATTPLGLARWGALVGLSVLTMGVGLGSSGRLTYHEAIVAQAAREMIASGDMVSPTIGGRPWLEKPPLAIWLAAASGRVAGGVTEFSARLPSAVAAGLLVLGLAWLASRRFGATVGFLAGMVQATTAWTVMRGRLAEADILLACLVTWTLLAFDLLREEARADSDSETPGVNPGRPRAFARWGFFGGLGLMSLAKGPGFGAALVLAAVLPLLVLERDRKRLRFLIFGPGCGLAMVVAAVWPLVTLARYPAAWGLWSLHVSDRLADRPEHFIGQSGLAYAGEILLQLLPWAPLAVVGAWSSLGRAAGKGGRAAGAGDRLLWAWAVGPIALLSLATVKNAHYTIHALPPCSVWAALGITRLADRLQRARGWTPRQVWRLGGVTFAGLGLFYAIGFAGLGPWFDRRGVEWAFYQEAAGQLRQDEPLALLYHVPEWDRKPYETPFGPFPHDYAVRLYYLNRSHSVPCRFGIDDLAGEVAGGRPSTFAVIGREEDGPALSRFGRVQTLAKGPTLRSDRTYLLFRVTPEPSLAAGRPPTSRLRIQ